MPHAKGVKGCLSAGRKDIAIEQIGAFPDRSEQGVPGHRLYILRFATARKDVALVKAQQLFAMRAHLDPVPCKLDWLELQVRRQHRRRPKPPDDFPRRYGRGTLRHDSIAPCWHDAVACLILEGRRRGPRGRIGVSPVKKGTTTSVGKIVGRQAD